MLLELRDYLIEKKTANLQELAQHFKQSPELVRCWLMHWVRKGRVFIIENSKSCASKCQNCAPQCSSQTPEFYGWVDSSPR